MSRTNRINDQGADRGCSHSFGSGGPSTNLLVINIKYSCGKQYHYLMSLEKQYHQLMSLDNNTGLRVQSKSKRFLWFPRFPSQLVIEQLYRSSVSVSWEQIV